MITMAYPWVLLFIFLPFVLRVILPKSKKNKNTSINIPYLSSLKKDLDTSPKTSFLLKRSILFYVIIFIWCLLVFSGSGIQWLGKPVYIQQSGRDLITAVDISGSMKTPDMILNGQPITRINLVKKIVSNFIAQRYGDRVGLILFGSKPYLQTPLTFDLDTVKQMLDDATVGIAGMQTAIGDAIGLSIKQLMKYPNQSKALILLTDGANNTGSIDPTLASQLTKDEKIKIYVIGLGANKLTVPTFWGQRTVNPSSDLDISGLKKIAETTGGKFFRAENSKDLKDIYTYINKLEPVKSDKLLVRAITPLYPWLLGLALLISFFVTLYLEIRKKEDLK